MLQPQGTQESPAALCPTLCPTLSIPPSGRFCLQVPSLVHPLLSMSMATIPS